MSARDDAALITLVNGVIWPGFQGRSAPDWLKRALDDGLAGVVYFGHNIDPDDPGQPRALSDELRSIRPAALIGADEEGGNVSRLEAAHGSTLPSAAQLGRVDDVDVTRRVGAELGRRLAASGVNLGLAPVADVNTNPRNPVIGVRSYGADAALVARHVAATVAGMQSAGVAACVKHYPGHGDTLADSHHDLPRVDLTWAEIERDHLPPFLAAIDAGVRAVMSAHIVVPERGVLPATLNPRILASLRSAGFDGVIVTDALDMAAIRSSVGSGAGAVRAILAGADLLCIGNPSNLGPKGGAARDVDDYLEVRDALFDALDDGTLGIAALEAAAERVQQLAEGGEATPSARATDAARAANVIGSADAARNEDAAEFAAAVRSACSVDGTVLPLAVDAGVVVLDVRRAATIAVASTADVFTAALAERTAVTKIGVDVTDAAADALLAAALENNRGGVVVLVDAIGTDGPQHSALEAIARIRPDAVVVNSGVVNSGVVNSGVGGRAPLTVITTFGAGTLAAAAATQIMIDGSTYSQNNARSIQ